MKRNGLSSHDKQIDRRSFLSALSVAMVAAVGCDPRRPAPTNVAGKLSGASSSLGHLLRKREDLPKPGRTSSASVVIVGGGVAGMTAAWQLEKAGVKNVVLVELESNLGGNAQSGRNEIGAYPWGAHYLPIPGLDNAPLVEMLDELGVIRSWDRQLPSYDETFLCADPHERLLIHGRWQDGIVPAFGVPSAEREQIQAFQAEMDAMERAVGSDGKRAFSIPLDTSSADMEFRRLDKISMGAFMRERGYTSPYLRWYVDYCCRDDYGVPAAGVSAWAGIHYFASRTGKASNADKDSVLTWPEGNGWLVGQLEKRVTAKILRKKLVYEVAGEALQPYVDVYDPATSSSERIHAEAIIVATPRFVAANIVRTLRENPPPYLKGMQYAPWLVANATVSRFPAGKGAPLSWDNVSHQSPSLGYVVSTHQSPAQPFGKTVLTYYHPIPAETPSKGRQILYETSDETWKRFVHDDLLAMNPELRGAVERIDLWKWGHGMIIPAPGLIWGGHRAAAKKPIGNIFFAHSDLSGISIFEEAFHHGIDAAKAVAGRLA